MDCLISAWKRANHFCHGQPEAPFSTLRFNEGPLIAASNYQWMLDAERHSDTDDFHWVGPGYDRAIGLIESFEMLEDIQIHSLWAESLNRYIDSHKVADDDNLLLALACWKSRMAFNPLKLVK